MDPGTKSRDDGVYCASEYDLDTSRSQRDDPVMSGWVYIMTNKRNGTLYVGVTARMAARAWEHKTGAVPGFTKKYGLKMLVYAEPHDRIEAAIYREKTIKNWTRARKIRLIESMNPHWKDLYDQIL
ncbi:hypothetical protein DLREEDagr8_24790 [Dongia sp. agr-C8]